ncbi:cyanophycinase [Occallatibacter riparius]|uniref:Cyanophycinase n=1 Tax=Occallatibacter riparius TaxID=1002689 RepID=A0A9J7BGL3_9BACT|nr:cyanophycinase [Occallatibacter riparius]UWZ82116.1 cyanophycinase [Occallatibacter riparius]
MNRILALIAATLVGVSLPCLAQSEHAYKYFRAGSPADATTTHPRAGYALMGGGTDLDEAFQWLCNRAGGGDFLILRATGDDDYNPYVQQLCPKLNSVATLILPNRAAAEDPFAASTIRAAEAIFIAGGDQANYINFWMKSPVQDALNDDIARSIPLGGTSAGLAVMGEWAYSAQGDKPDDPNLSGKLALSDPLGSRITLTQNFLRIPILNGIITDTHFVRRDRMGRLLVFLARLNATPGTPVTRGIGIEEKAAVLLEPDGSASVIGRGGAYFIDTPKGTGIAMPYQPLTWQPYAVQKVPPGHTFNFKTWTGESTAYQLNVKNGQITSMQHGGVIY